MVVVGDNLGLGESFSDQLEVYPIWHSGYHLKVFFLLIVYFCLFDNLHFPRVFSSS